jgi:hypothetical protein
LDNSIYDGLFVQYGQLKIKDLSWYDTYLLKNESDVAKIHIPKDVHLSLMVTLNGQPYSLKKGNCLWLDPVLIAMKLIDPSRFPLNF